MMFDEFLNGYYVHGKSPTGRADLSSENLCLALEQEKRGKASFRGLVASRPDQQTFEMNMPLKMLQKYNKHFTDPLNDIVRKSGTQANNANAASAVGTILSLGEPLPDDVWQQWALAQEQGTKVNLEMTKNLMNKIMRKYLEQVRNDP